MLAGGFSSSPSKAALYDTHAASFNKGEKNEMDTHGRRETMLQERHRAVCRKYLNISVYNADDTSIMPDSSTGVFSRDNSN